MAGNDLNQAYFAEHCTRKLDAVFVRAITELRAKTISIKNLIPTKLSELFNDAGYITDAYHDSSKQDTISDLAEIRSGAAAGSTAVQPADLEQVAFTGSYLDLIDTPPGTTNPLTSEEGTTKSSVIYPRLKVNQSGTNNDWIQTPKYGILPYADDDQYNCRLGTDNFPFRSIRANDMKQNGNRVQDSSTVISESISGGSQTVGGSSYVAKTISVAKTNYLPIAVAGFASGANYIAVPRCFINGTTLNFTLRNLTTSSQTTTPTFYILYLKTN